MRGLMIALALTSGLLSGFAESAPSSGPDGSSVPGGRPTFLRQAWTDEDRSWFYSVTQGSQIMPYAWFMSLERPATESLFAADRLARFGYLPNPYDRAPYSRRNPDGLPIGFVKDVDDRGEWVGMTCAACHTNRLEYKGKAYQVDGGPANADMFAFIKELGQTLSETAVSGAKFDRFKARVLGARSTVADGERLFRNVKAFSDQFSQYVASSTAKVEWGPARLDAFGMIFNRATSIDLNDPRNVHEPNAPVSYPFLWGTSWHDFVQWNGSAPNDLTVERLGRNVGEVLGVFGRTEIGRTALPLYFDTSVDRTNLLEIENRLRRLRAPKWPAAFGVPERNVVAAGAKLYSAMCVSCHALGPTGTDRHQKVTLTPLAEVGTDPTMATNAASLQAHSGVLEGVRMPFLLTTPPLKETEKSLDLVSHIVAGAILAPIDRLFSPGRLAADQALLLRSLARKGQATVITANELMNDLQPLLGKGLARQFLANKADRNVMVYKARPLDGIWATAPYLHNGSVPNLRELLLPPDQRSTLFSVGSREFEPDSVGFNTKSGFLFDTSLPGNSNKGHDYGVGKLTPAEREELLAYLKTL